MRKIITLICLVSVSQLFPQGTLDVNLLAYYPFNGNTDDLSVNGYDATPFGVVYGEDRAGIPNSACYFDGVDDYVNFPNIAELKVPLPVSFSFWIKYEGTTYQEQVVFNTSMEEDHATSVVFNAQNGTSKYVINYADGQYYYGPESRRSYVSNSVIDTGSWHHIAIVVNSATDMKIYVDCVESGGVYSGEGDDLEYSMQPGCIGRHDRSLSTPLDYFKGYIDEFRYWSRALNEDDITKLCDASILSLVETTPKADFIIYPNPATSELNIETGAEEIKSVSIFNRLGQQVYSGQSRQIDISHYASGLYVVKVEGISHAVSKNIVIE